MTLQVRLACFISTLSKNMKLLKSIKNWPEKKTPIDYQNLGTFYRNIGKEQEAQEYFDEAAKSYEQVLSKTKILPLNLLRVTEFSNLEVRNYQRFL